MTKLFMDGLQEELGITAEETILDLSSTDIVKLNSEIASNSNDRLLKQSPVLADRFPCSI